VLAKRWLSENQTTQSTSGVGLRAGGGTICRLLASRSARRVRRRRPGSGWGRPRVRQRPLPLRRRRAGPCRRAGSGEPAGGTASHSRQASARSSIDASSTTRASIGSGIAGMVTETAGFRRHAEQSVQRVRLARQQRLQLGRQRSRRAERRASSMRAAALPVGAARAMRKPGFSPSRQASSATTVVVLPVPGPPLMIVKHPRQASAAASFCQSGRPSRRSALAAKSASSCPRRASPASVGRCLARRRRFSLPAAVRRRNSGRGRHARRHRAVAAAGGSMARPSCSLACSPATTPLASRRRRSSVAERSGKRAARALN
jgi:hypothetical protein